MKKQMAAVAVGAALLGGGAVGMALGAPAIASADSASSSSARPTAADGSEPTPAKAGWVEDVFERLVSDGTITQAQADEVQAALEAARPERGPGGPGGPGMHGPKLDAVAEALGIDGSELRTELQSGTTIAAVAEAKGVDVQTVIDALVAEMQSHLDAAVENGRLTQERADELKADATERATAIVNGERPDGPPSGMGPGGPDRPGGPGGWGSGSDSFGADSGSGTPTT